jgi:metal-responsive CopG/Arc/MetJ family transcriptional regulator
MKTAVSIPADVLAAVECPARRTKRSRSNLLRDAIREYVARHGQENITEATDRVCAELGQPADEFVSAPRAASSKEANGDFVG